MYTPEEKEDLFEAVCMQIEQGKALTKLIHGKNKIISNTLWNELVKDKEKNARYAHACEVRADSIFEEILEIADNGENDEIPHPMIEGATMTNHENIQRSKLRVDARKWMLAKMQPKKYGDKVDLTSDGEKLQGTIINLGSGKNPDETTE